MDGVTVDAVLSLLKDNAVAIGLLGAALTFMWGGARYIYEQGRAARLKEFEIYHGLIRDLVKPQTSDDTMYVDRQCAVLFELRFYPRYDPQTLRMIKHLLQSENWIGHPRMLKELTIGELVIEKRIKSVRMWLIRTVKPFSFFKE